MPALTSTPYLQAKASQAGPGPAHSLVSEPALASKDGMKLTKLQYDDVYEEWTQKVEENDLRRSQLEVQEFELRKKCLREALSPENLIDVLDRLKTDPKEDGIPLLSTYWGQTECKEVCKAIQKEGPDWLELESAMKPSISHSADLKDGGGNTEEKARISNNFFLNAIKGLKRV